MALCSVGLLLCCVDFLKTDFLKRKLKLKLTLAQTFNDKILLGHAHTDTHIDGDVN